MELTSSVELEPQIQLVADTKPQGISDSKTDLSIDKKDSPSTVPVSVGPVQAISTHTNDVLGTLLEEWKSAKERMVLVKDGVAKIQEKHLLLLSPRIENESKKLFQAFHNLKRFDQSINELGKNVSKQSVYDMLDAFSLGTKAIQQSRQKFKQLVWLKGFGEQLIKCTIGVCLTLIILFVLLWMLMLTGSVFVVLGMVVTVGFFVWVLKPVKLPQLVGIEGKELLESMRLLEISLVSILAMLRCLPIKE